MRNKMKTMLVVLVILSTMATVVNAGNKGIPVLDTVTTNVLEIVHQVTIAITSPVDNTRFGSTSVNIGYETTNVLDTTTIKYSLNGAPMVVTTANPIPIIGADDGTDGGQLNTVVVNVTDPVNGSAEATVNFKVDITPPGQVTGITSTKGTNYVNWTWTPPGNSDFANVIVNVTQGITPVYSDVIILKGTNWKSVV